MDLRNTCDGGNSSRRALSWGAVAGRHGGDRHRAPQVDDSAVSNGEPFVHWVIGGLNPRTIALVEGDVPEGTVQALEKRGCRLLGPSCPPEGDDAHVYGLTAYALDSPLQLDDGALGNKVLDAIATATLRVNGPERHLSALTPGLQVAIRNLGAGASSWSVPSDTGPDGGATEQNPPHAVHSLHPRSTTRWIIRLARWRFHVAQDIVRDAAISG